MEGIFSHEKQASVSPMASVNTLPSSAPFSTYSQQRSARSYVNRSQSGRAKLSLSIRARREKAINTRNRIDLRHVSLSCSISDERESLGDMLGLLA